MRQTGCAGQLTRVRETLKQARADRKALRGTSEADGSRIERMKAAASAGPPGAAGLRAALRRVEAHEPCRPERGDRRRWCNDSPPSDVSGLERALDPRTPSPIEGSSAW